MKKLHIIILFLLSYIVFADDTDYKDVDYNTIYDCITNSIESQYIKKIEPYISSGIMRYKYDSLDQINIYIYFEPDVYEFKNEINDFIENKIIMELKKIYSNYDISIKTLYPFNIIIKNYIEYNLNDKRKVYDDIHYNTNGIFIDNIFNNSIYGYFSDKYFDNSPDETNRVNKIYHNNFNIFLELIYKYYGAGNIVYFN